MYVLDFRSGYSGDFRNTLLDKLKVNGATVVKADDPIIHRDKLIVDGKIYHNANSIVLCDDSGLTVQKLDLLKPFGWIVESYSSAVDILRNKVLLFSTAEDHRFNIPDLTYGAKTGELALVLDESEPKVKEVKYAHTLFTKLPYDPPLVGATVFTYMTAPICGLYTILDKGANHYIDPELSSMLSIDTSKGYTMSYASKVDEEYEELVSKVPLDSAMRLASDLCEDLDAYRAEVTFLYDVDQKSLELIFADPTKDPKCVNLYSRDKVCDWIIESIDIFRED